MTRINPLGRIKPGAPMCSSGKSPYETEDEAKRHLARAQHNRGEDIDHGRVKGSAEGTYYQCPVCHWYHLASSARPTRRSQISARHERNRRR